MKWVGLDYDWKPANEDYQVTKKSGFSGWNVHSRWSGWGVWGGITQLGPDQPIYFGKADLVPAWACVRKSLHTCDYWKFCVTLLIPKYFLKTLAPKESSDNLSIPSRYTALTVKSAVQTKGRLKVNQKLTNRLTAIEIPIGLSIQTQNWQAGCEVE